MMKIASTLFVLTALSTSAFASPCPEASTQIGSSKINWGNCPTELGGQGNDTSSGLQCGNLTVPIDYKNPNGESIPLALIRIKSTGKAKHQGSLIFNPGGPGGVSTLFVALAAQGTELFSQEIKDSYDIIGVDPRGVGLSHPVMCDHELWNKRMTSFPKDQKEFEELVAFNRKLGESCAAMTGPLINHLDTTHVVQDFELVRQALNEEKLNLIGLSYGTQIGQQYAEMFPERVGRFVLDGVVDHGQSETDALVTESTTFELTLNEFFRWCGTDKSCSLGTEAARVFDEVVKKADESPISAPGCATKEAKCRPAVSGEDLIVAIQEKLFTKEADPPLSAGWAIISQGLEEASNGNATILSPGIADSEGSDALYNFSELAIGCQDWSHKAQYVGDLQLRMQMAAVLNPRTRGISQTYQFQTWCIGWPAPTTNPQRPLDGKQLEKAPAVLLWNSLRDPITSLVWANSVKDGWSKSVLGIRNGAGHTSYFLKGDSKKAMDKFLLQGVLPEQGQTFES